MSRATGTLLGSESQLDSALHRFVDEHDRVDYAAIGAEGTAERGARELERFPLDSLQAREDKLAFWINAHNTPVLAGVLNALKRIPQQPRVAPDGRLGLLRFFYLKRYLVGGKKLSRAAIENRILRKELREPRVHFALVCAATSCPPLKQGLYTAGRRLPIDHHAIHFGRRFDEYILTFGKLPRHGHDLARRGFSCGRCTANRDKK